MVWSRVGWLSIITIVVVEACVADPARSECAAHAGRVSWWGVPAEGAGAVCAPPRCIYCVRSVMYFVPKSAVSGKVALRQLRLVLRVMGRARAPSEHWRGERWRSSAEHEYERPFRQSAAASASVCGAGSSTALQLVQCYRGMWQGVTFLSRAALASMRTALLCLPPRRAHWPQ